MAQLAIKGHKSRGNEVIEILEMLGGKNLHNYCADCDSLCFYIGKETNIIYYDYVNNCEDLLIVTLEEFEQKFPYKVGDKIVYKIYGIHSKIKTMLWNVEKEQVFYRLESNKLFVATADELQPYKEDAMDKAIKPVFDANAQCCDIMNQLIKEETMEEELIPRINFDKYCKDKYLLDLGNYEIKDENGKTYAVRKQFEHPKSYEECCDVLKIPNNERYIYIDVPLSYNKVLKTFTQLLICRDAYWKIAGEQMGLGEPWKPDFTNDDEERYGIYTTANKVVKDFCGVGDVNVILTFPTEEMRDAFYENFNDDIEFCKEFL